MHDHTATSTALLEGLKDPHNQTLWSEYLGRHRPLIMAYCTRLGVPRADAEDLAQEALLAFAHAYRDGRYDAGRGRLRGWLHGIVRNVVQTWHRRKKRRGEVQPETEDGTGFFGRLADPHALDQVWEQEWTRAVVQAAVARARAEFEPATFAAFERFACNDEPAEVVARDLGLSRNAVYIAKHRVLGRVRELRQEVERLWQ